MARLSAYIAFGIWEYDMTTVIGIAPDLDAAKQVCVDNSYAIQPRDDDGGRLWDWFEIELWTAGSSEPTALWERGYDSKDWKELP